MEISNGGQRSNGQPTPVSRLASYSKFPLTRCFQSVFGNAMFEKKTRLRVKRLLEKQFHNFHELEQVCATPRLDKSNKVVSLQSLKNTLIDSQLDINKSAAKKVPSNRSTNERNMTRKTRSRRPRIHSVFQSGYCAVCHAPYASLEDHIQSKRHLKLIGDDGSFISIKGFDSFLALDGIDSIGEWRAR